MPDLLASAEKIKELYPLPVSYQKPSSWAGGEYCVLGAFCFYNNISMPPHFEAFPLAELVTTKLRERFPHLKQRYQYLTLRNKVAGIVKANDNEHFDKAWASLDKLIIFINAA